jgi:NDP-sugar pyrophosphorylase family protein
VPPSRLPSHALVLTAGLGTRLRPLTDVRAKPAIPVAGRPMILRILDWLAANGVADVVLNLHHLPHTLTGLVGDGAEAGVRVRYSWEPRVLGSGGGPRHALPLVPPGPVLVVNGDTLTDLALDPLAAAHARAAARVTLALVPNTEPDRYGGVLIDDAERVTGFVARGPAARGSYHFIGVQIADADVFADIPDDTPAASIGGVYDALIARQPGTVRGFVADAGFHDVGTPADYLRTHEALLRSVDELPLGRGTRIDRSARVERSILWDDVDVAAGCDLEACIVADGVRVPAGRRYRRAAIVRGAGGEPLATPFPFS